MSKDLTEKQKRASKDLIIKKLDVPSIESFEYFRRSQPDANDNREPIDVFMIHYKEWWKPRKVFKFIVFKSIITSMTEYYSEEEILFKEALKESNIPLKVI